ncbi:hypothetical protein Tco_0758348, partial [Tanacetum coccineum]
DDTDEEDEEPFEDEDDDEEEEEEHLASVDSSIVPIVDLVPSTGDIEAFKTDESAPTPRSPQIRIPFAQTRVRRAWKIVILEPPMLPSMEARIAEYVVTPAPPSLLSPWSPPLSHIPLPPLPPPPSSLHLPPPVPTSLPLPSSLLPTLPVLLFIPPPVDCREDITEAELPPHKRLCLTAPTSRDVLVDPTEVVEEVASTTLEGVNARVTELAVVQEQDTHDIYVMIENTQDRQTQLFQSVDGLGQLSAALGQIQALQARDQTHADDHVGAASTNNMPPRRSSATTRATATVAARAAAPMTVAAVEQLIEARVSAELANHETLQNSTNGHGDESHNSDTGIKGTVRTPRECTYKDFLNCKPFTFKGTKGVVVLSQWFEKMELVFHISNYDVENQVKFAACTFLGNALTWWNSHMKTVTQDVAYAMD